MSVIIASKASGSFAPRQIEVPSNFPDRTFFLVAFPFRILLHCRHGGTKEQRRGVLLRSCAAALLFLHVRPEMRQLRVRRGAQPCERAHVSDALVETRQPICGELVVRAVADGVLVGEACEVRLLGPHRQRADPLPQHRVVPLDLDRLE